MPEEYRLRGLAENFHRQDSEIQAARDDEGRLKLDLPNDRELRALDDDLATEGISILDRPVKALFKWAVKVGTQPLDSLKAITWFREQFSSLHPSVNFTKQPFAFLSVSASGISYELNPPIVFGRVRDNPINNVVIQPQELERIFQRSPASFWEMHYQAADGFDLFMGEQNFQQQVGSVQEMMAVGFSNLEASSRQLVAGSADAGIAHATCIAVETLTKGVLKENGFSDAELKNKLGHSFEKMVKAITTKFPSQNDAEYLDVARSLPDLVASRYKSPVLKMNEAQDLYRRGLFLSAEAVRRVSRHTIYRQLAADQTVPKRQW